LVREKIHPAKKVDELWNVRYEQINHFESYLVENEIVVLKLFLHISKGEQKKRFLARLDDPQKNWKFSENDAKERAFWDDYQQAFEEMLNHTSTAEAPWYVIPADHKWFAHYLVAKIIVDKLESLNLAFPKITAEQKKSLEKARKLLE